MKADIFPLGTPQKAGIMVADLKQKFYIKDRKANTLNDDEIEDAEIQAALVHGAPFAPFWTLSGPVFDTNLEPRTNARPS